MISYAIVQHSYSEFLGPLEAQFQQRNNQFSYFRPFLDGGLPGSAAQDDALFLLGGAIPTADRFEATWVDDELNTIASFAKANRAVVGFGFGGMVVAEYAGAVVDEEPFHQAYWTKAHMTEAGKGDKLAEIIDGQEVLVMVNGSAQLPEGLEPILVDDEGRWLAIRPEQNMYGMLFRPELKPGMIEDMVMEQDRETPDHIGEILVQAREKMKQMQKITDDVLVALVMELGLMQERSKMPVFSLTVEK